MTGRWVSEVWPAMTSGYVRVQTIHPDWKDGICRDCGKHLPDRIHKDALRGVEPEETLCHACNSAYDPAEFNTVVGEPSVADVAVNQQGVTERL